MRRSRVLVAAAALLATLYGSRASADTITLSFRLVASGFDAEAPVDPVTGVFSITFDNSANLLEQTAGIAVSNLNIALDSPPAFGYGAVADVLVVGALIGGAQTLSGGTNDFLFSILDASTNPVTPFDFIYSQAPSLTVHRGTVSLLPASAPIPEPATMTLLGAGAAVALVRRRKRRMRSASRDRRQMGRHSFHPTGTRESGR
jgi:PEP-CTERM motif-containing protein